MSPWFEKGGVIYARTLAVAFLVVGVGGVLSAVADVISAVLDRLDSGSWHFAPFLQLPVPWALAHPSVLQQAVIWLSGTPQFVLNALIGAALLRAGAYRWIDADLPRNSNT